MKANRHLLDEIDRYLNGEMDEAEKTAFEDLCRSNNQIREQVSEQAEFRKLLEAHADHRAFKSRLAKAQARMTISSSPATPQSMGTGRITSFRKQLIQTIAIAASVALLVASLFMWMVHDYSNSSRSNTYMILRREIDNIKRSQTALMHNITTAGAPPADHVSYGGTGFAIASNGYIATNSHVIENADSVYIQNNKGEAYKTQLVYKDPNSDLAILKVVDSTFMLPALPYIVTPHPADIGEEVYTLGYPKDDIVYGKGYISAATGYQSDTSSYQVSLSVNPGNSGGPLLDSRGNIVGVVSGKQSSSSDVAFAIKADNLQKLLNKLPADFNEHCSIFIKSSTNPLHLSRVGQIKKLEDYIFMVKVYN